MYLVLSQGPTGDTFQIEILEFRSVGIWGEGKTGVPGEKPPRARMTTNNKLIQLTWRRVRESNPGPIFFIFFLFDDLRY